MEGWQPPPPAPTGIVRLTIRDCWPRIGTSPLVRVNGWSYDCRYGVQDVYVWPGRNRLEVEVGAVLWSGPAVLDVDVPAGRIVQVWYSPPWTWPFPGRLGLRPQARAGGWVYVIFTLLFLLGSLVWLVPA